MPEDTNAQQGQQICAILWLVRPSNMTDSIHRAAKHGNSFGGRA